MLQLLQMTQTTMAPLLALSSSYKRPTRHCLDNPFVGQTLWLPCSCRVFTAVVVTAKKRYFWGQPREIHLDHGPQLQPLESLQPLCM